MKRKTTTTRKRSTRPNRRTRETAHGLPVAHGVEVAPAAHGVERPALPPDYPESTFAAEVMALLDSYALPAADLEVRRLAAYAVRLRQAWQAAEGRCIERHAPERRAGSAERAASFAYQQAMARLIETARALAALPARH